MSSEILDGPADIKVRPATPDDAPVVADIYRPYVEGSVASFETTAPTVEEMAERIRTSLVWMVAEAPPGTEPVGYAYAAPFHRRAAYRWSVEVSIYLAPAARGRAIGGILLTVLLRRLEAMGYVNAFAGTTLPNEASVRLFEAHGFERVALQRKVGFKLGAWHDVGWWQKQLREPPTPPPALGGPDVPPPNV